MARAVKRINEKCGTLLIRDIVIERHTAPHIRNTIVSHSAAELKCSKLHLFIESDSFALEVLCEEAWANFLNDT